LPLSNLGRAQAAALASVVTGAARVVCSPLRRARETAEAFGLPVDIDDRWVEMDYGEYDLQPLAELPADVWRQWRTDLTFRPPGGESIAEVGERVRAACTDLLGEATEADVVVVSHVSPIKAAVAWSLGVGDEAAWRMNLAVAAVSRVGVGPTGVPVLRSFNETTHLG
jgi:broad specificity phosphatase PhoE